ncbi:DNA-directed RNA polymerase III subunit RPC9 isoform X2 [Bemisia tabaci]|uniref:DNA-directed RNA polymerase III subunit RPC9 isoform X2 n=1 Tax=Bemisia tabaci TaxID=7038 RepID=UPI0008F99B53|nr:PREDICTED: uncharacterized protein LOC109034823 [Bemisia tabaci]
MEVTNSSAALLCNYEVLTYLNELKSKAQTAQEKNSHLATILYETSHYLTDSLNNAPRIANIPEFLTDLLSFPVALTKEEKLLLVNSPPSSALQLSLLIKDCDDRLSENQIESLLEIIKKNVTEEQLNIVNQQTSRKKQQQQ